MASIDNRVVSISFDNSAFQKNVQDTIRGLDDLKTKMNFGNATSGFSDISKAANGVDISSIGRAVDGIAGKFTAMGAVVFTVLQNITNQAFNAAKDFSSAFTLDPIRQGFAEYETNMKSIQTILANTASDGTTLKDVTKSLDELNQYSDQTIYNFAEMTKNIGTFTAAGVDLQTSTEAIKGIANLAAVSGSTSEQAASGMYQLSQAIATGTVRLIDWNSVTNAGMGGEVFQKALFETGKTLGTIADTPIDTTFEEWTAGGNSFRSSLEDNWLTSEVLTTTLKGFTGDLTEAQIKALGYTDKQAAEILKMGKIASDAATEVKTLSQLLSTTKENLGSGWSESFRIIIGDFDQAKKLFTDINNSVKGFADNSSDARNGVLEQWRDFGGRTRLIIGLTEAFKSLGTIFKPIQEAFREIFPRKTGKDLLELTKKFVYFAKDLAITGETADTIKNIFVGFFSAIKLGAQFVKDLIEVVINLASRLTNGGDSVLVYAEKIANFFTGLSSGLQSAKRFTEQFGQEFNLITFITESISSAFSKLKDSLNLSFLDGVGSFFSGIFDNFNPELTNSMSGGFDRLGDRLGLLGKVVSGIGAIFSKFGDVFSWFWEKTITVKDAVVSAVDSIVDAFAGFGPAVLRFFESENFDKVIELAKVAIAGMFGVGFNKLAFSGLKFDFTGGALSGFSDLISKINPKSISKGIDGLSGSLQAMQTNLQAQALMKIAAAIAILVASIVVLSMIDAGALAKATGALTALFIQLIGALALFTKVTAGPKSGLSFSLMAGGLIALAAAILILSVAVKILSTMSWEELGKGLSAVVGLLVALTVTINLMPSGARMISMGLGIIAIAVAMNLLALAMKIFATMSWKDMAKGFTGVVGGLLAIAGAMHLMPSNLPLTASGLVLVGVALNLIAASMKIFATMSWEEIGKGFTGVVGGLLAIAGAMHLMPSNLPLTATGLILVGIALNIIAASMKIFATMSWEELGKGLAAIAGALLILAVATNAMNGAIPGAIAIGIVALSLILLSTVIKELSKLSLAELGIGILAIAAVLAVLAVSAMLIQPFIGPLFLLSLALLAIGAAFAVFGIGASLVATAIETLINAGTAGIELIKALLGAILETLPALLAAAAEGLVAFILIILEATPTVVASLIKIIGMLLEAIIELTPKIVETVVNLALQLFAALELLFPRFVETGITFILSMLQGIRDNIYNITTLVYEIVTLFLEAVTDRLPDMLTAGVNLLITFIQGITDNISTIALAVTDLIVAFITEIGNSAEQIVTAGGGMIANIITGIGNASETIVTAGFNALMSFLQGVADNIQKAVDKGFEIVIELLNGVANSIRENKSKLAEAGLNLLDAIFGGIIRKAIEVTAWFVALPGKIIGWIGDALGTLVTKGAEFITGLWTGIQDRIIGVKTWFGNLGETVVGWIGDGLSWLTQIGKNIVEGLWNGILAMKDWLEGKIGWFINLLPGFVKDVLGIESPSKVMRELGLNIGQGLGLGIMDSKKYTSDASKDLASSVIDNMYVSDKDLANQTIQSIKNALAMVSSDLGNMDEFNPTITPVLDLTEVQRDALSLNSIFAMSPLSASASYNQASLISTAENQRANAEASVSSTQEVNFNQVINSPTALSTNDIYRQTRSQIALAKKELSLV